MIHDVQGTQPALRVDDKEPDDQVLCPGPRAPGKAAPFRALAPDDVPLHRFFAAAVVVLVHEGKLVDRPGEAKVQQSHFM